MKVVAPKEMARIEKLAYKEGASEVDFMENAGIGVAASARKYIEKNLPSCKRILLLCGKGNNAGDAYVAGVHLKEDFEISALQLEDLPTCSTLCQKNAHRLKPRWVEKVTVETLQTFDLIIDGLFGTGFHGKVEEPYFTAIKMANSSNIPILSVDIPSGLNGETGEIGGIAIKATQTAFLELPKQGFFFKEGLNQVGILQRVPFGLDSYFTDQAQSDLELLTTENLATLLPPIVRNRHKYQRGSVIGLAGSPEMPGAAMLSSLAVLKGGAGIVRLLHPEGMQSQLASSPYELIKIPYQFDQDEKILQMMNKASASFIGPGLGQSDKSLSLLQTLLPKLEKPSVIDADGLNLLSQMKINLPKQAILTPHKGEMLRLLHRKDNPEVDAAFLKLCQEYAEKHHVTIVLKGAATFILHPGEVASVNIRGDAGMATAGSGDVLTGLLAALLAQGLSPLNAARLGVYLHALSGEFAAKKMSSYSMIASDIIDSFPDAFRELSLK